MRVGRIERQRTHRDVAQHLGEDAAGADHHRRAELAVMGDADDHLDAVGCHLLHEHAVDARRRVDLRGLVDELGEGRPHRVGVGDTHLDETDIALVREVGRRDLHDDRIAEEIGGGHRGIGRIDDYLAGERHAERGQHGAGTVRVERASGGKRGADRVARPARPTPAGCAARPAA